MAKGFRFPKFSRAEIYFLVVLLVAGLFAINGLVDRFSDKSAREQVRDATQKQFAKGFFGALISGFLLRAAPAILASIGIAGFPAVGTLATVAIMGTAFIGLGGYEVLNAYFEFLPDIKTDSPNNPGSDYRCPDGSEPINGVLCVGGASNTENVASPSGMSYDDMFAANAFLA